VRFYGHVRICVPVMGGGGCLQQFSPAACWTSNVHKLVSACLCAAIPLSAHCCFALLQSHCGWVVGMFLGLLGRMIRWATDRTAVPL
jgi:hypothetical protein